ncbi:MAG TPA: hypothetical protein VK172_14270 [Lentimicrobium sp.]|nr:hypothetical protein [Lentimicrobium sp.]
MRKSKNSNIPDGEVQQSDLTQELERLLNENNALLKVLKRITTDEDKSDTSLNRREELKGNKKK